jgi:hypothetical protein
MRRCALKSCRKQFEPTFNTVQAACSWQCALALVTAKREREEVKAKKAERALDKAAKEAQKRLPDLKKEAQAAFNAYIRARDAGRPCICCGQPMLADRPGGAVDAGHFLSVGSAPELRFEPDNVHAQRKSCNRPGGTTRSKFRAGMVERIGLGRVEWLEGPHQPKHYTRDDLRAIRDTYRNKIKAFKS